MKTTRIFKLERAARKSGGDRYMQLPGEGASISATIYIDQETSRGARGKPLETLTITVESED